jgi:hypothetical protein
MNLQAETEKCVYCDLANPTRNHVESHRLHEQHQQFNRADNAEAHIRTIHKVSNEDARRLRELYTWECITDGPFLCGFCQEDLPSWEERTEHIADHLSQGMTKDDWTKP